MICPVVADNLLITQTMEHSETPSSIVVNSTAATFGDDAGASADVVQPQDGRTSAKTNLGSASAHPKSTAPERATLLAELLASLPSNYDVELQHDPNFSEFVRFHNLVKGFEPVEGFRNGPVPKYNWDVLSCAFEHVYKLYTNEINDILADFDKLDIKRSIWQESAFRMDGERASRRFRSIESWISDSDRYLNVMRKDLSSSVQIIRHTLDKLNNPSPPRDDEMVNDSHDHDEDNADTTPIVAKASAPTPI